MGVHIVVPYYMDPRYLFELIDGVRNQTSDDWRLTIVDDQYPGTAARDHIAALGDPRVEWVQNEHNLGATGNTCRCIRLGELDHITIMGADDALEPTYVEVVQRAFEQHPDAVMVHPGVVVVDADGNPTDSLADRVKRTLSRTAWRQGEIDGPTAARSLMKGNWLYVPAMCFRTDAIARVGDIDQFASIADLAWVMDMLLDGGTMVLDPTPVFRYRRYQTSHSSMHAKSLLRFEEEQRYYAAAARKLDDRGWRRAARVARLHPTSRLHAMRAAVGALAGRDAKLAGGLTRAALRRVG